MPPREHSAPSRAQHGHPPVSWPLLASERPPSSRDARRGVGASLPCVSWDPGPTRVRPAAAGRAARGPRRTSVWHLSPRAGAASACVAASPPGGRCGSFGCAERRSNRRGTAERAWGAARPRGGVSVRLRGLTAWLCAGAVCSADAGPIYGCARPPSRAHVEAARRD